MNPPPLVSETDHIAGGENASTILIEYGDYTCPHTRASRKIVSRHTDRIQKRAAFVFRQYPSRRRAEASFRASRFALAAGFQGKFWEAHEQLFATDSQMPIPTLKNVADQLDLDWQRLESDMQSARVTDQLAGDIAGAEQAGVVTTPTLFINGWRYDGAWDENAIVEEIERPVGQRLRSSSERFFGWAASAGLVLILATLVALAFVNFGFQDAYSKFVETKLGFVIGNANFSLSVNAWVNDGLMAIFFLLVGIEIKRELINGELSSLSKAMLPLAGAIGGMVVPILAYIAFNIGTATQNGWGIPMATDIAFTLGLLALLGDRVPISLKIFVSALAIADDLGAILVIAVFYGHGFHMTPLALALLTLIVMFSMNRGRIYARTPYVILGVILWYFVHESGLHATLAGVLTAAMIPSRDSGNVAGVAAQAAAIFEIEKKNTADGIGTDALKSLKTALERLREPGYHLQHGLESWSNFLILPLFAFCNTGILLTGAGFSFASPVNLGIMIGLVIGKPLGICLVCWVAVKVGLCTLPMGVNWQHMLGAGCLAGVGFTMSIFIATSAFGGEDLSAAKLSVLIASCLATGLGMIILTRSKRMAVSNYTGK